MSEEEIIDLRVGESKGGLTYLENRGICAVLRRPDGSERTFSQFGDRGYGFQTSSAFYEVKRIDETHLQIIRRPL